MMKRNISDLLDGYREDGVDLELATPLSARQIKKNTMSQINKKKTANFRWLTRVAAIAAIIAALTLTAFAAENVVNESFLSTIFEKPLTEKQNQTTERMDNNYSGNNHADKNSTEPVTSKEAAITPISVACDNRLCYLHIRLEAPEGVVLPDLPEDQTYSFSGKNYDERMQMLYFQNAEAVTNAKLTALPDEDPTDNIKEFVLEIYEDLYMQFRKSASLKIYGLWIKNVNNNTCKNVFKCDLKLDFAIGYSNDKIDIRDIGLSVYNEEYNFTVNLDRVYITPLRIVMCYTATSPNDAQEIVPDGGVCRIVMKDGTSILVGDQSNISDGEMVGYFRVSKAEEYTGLDMTNLDRECYLDDKPEWRFDKPIVLEDIDYIVWCGGQIIDVN